MSLLTTAEGGAGSIVVNVQCIKAPTVEIETPTDSPPNKQHARDGQPTESIASEAVSQPFQIIPSRRARPLVGAVGYLQGLR